MSLLITWVNPNARQTTVKIYRSNTPFDRQNMPAPVAEVDGTLEKWLDVDAVEHQSYYYILETADQHSTILSTERYVTVVHNRGVGPSEIIEGDEYLGYFGKIPGKDFLNNSHFLAVSNNAVGRDLWTPDWHKFIRRNKIIYVPTYPAGNFWWVDIYNAGFVYGYDGNGNANQLLGSITAPVNQYRPITFKGERYIPRLMTGYCETPQKARTHGGPIPYNKITSISSKMPLTVSPGATAVNEYNDFFYPLLNDNITSCTLPCLEFNGNNLCGSVYIWSSSDTAGGLGAANRGYFRIDCMESSPGNEAYVVSRGWTTSASTSSDNLKPALVNGCQVANLTASKSASTYVAGKWWPVVELEEFNTLEF